MATSQKRWALRALIFLVGEEGINGNLSKEVGIESPNIPGS